MTTLYNDSFELIPVPLSRAEMLSMGLVRSANTTRTAFDAAPTAVDVPSQKRALLATKDTVMRSNDIAAIRKWNKQWKALRFVATTDAAPKPFAAMENSIAAARQRLQAEKKPSPLRGA